MNTKSIFSSKTALAQVITVAAGFYPPARALVAAHPTETLAILGLVNIGLRFITKGRVALFA